MKSPEIFRPGLLPSPQDLREPVHIADNPYMYSPEPLREFMKKVPPQYRWTFSILTHLAVPVAHMHQILKTTLYPPKSRRSNESIAKAAIADPAILSPFTVVREGWRRELRAVPYHLHEELRPHLYTCQSLLHRAADVCPHPEMRQYFRELGIRVENGDFDGVMRMWTQAPSFPIHILLGVFESYDDIRFGMKTSPQLTLGITDQDGTKKYNEMRRRFVQQTSFIQDLLCHELSPANEVVLEVIQGGVFAGLQAEKKFVGQVLPNYPEQQRMFGAKILLIPNQYTVRFQEIFQAIERHFGGRALRELPGETTLRELSLGGLFPTEEQAHLWLLLPDAHERLRGMYNLINEVVAGILPLVVAARQYEQRKIFKTYFKNLLVVQLGETFVKIDAGAFEKWKKGQDPVVFFEGNEHLARDLIIFGRFIRDEVLVLGLHSEIVDIDLEAAMDSLGVMMKRYNEVYQSGTLEDARRFAVWDLMAILNTEIFQRMQWVRKAEEQEILPLNQHSESNDSMNAA